GLRLFAATRLHRNAQVTTRLLGLADAEVARANGGCQGRLVRAPMEHRSLLTGARTGRVVRAVPACAGRAVFSPSRWWGRRGRRGAVASTCSAPTAALSGPPSTPGGRGRGRGRLPRRRPGRPSVARPPGRS